MDGYEGDIGRGSIVVVNLHSPREKIWGLVLQMSALGITLRGIDLASFEDWMSEIASGKEEMTMGLTTLFVPMHRLEKVVLDEMVGAAKSCSDAFYERTRMTVKSYFEKQRG